MFMSQSNTFTGFRFPGLSCNNRTNTSPNPAVSVTLMSHNLYGCHDEVLGLPRRISNGQRRRIRSQILHNSQNLSDRVPHMQCHILDPVSSISLRKATQRTTISACEDSDTNA